MEKSLNNKRLIDSSVKIMKKKKFPSVLVGITFDFPWDTKKLWALDIPEEEIDIGALIWHFDYPFWFKPNGGYFDLTPAEVLESPEKYKEEYERLMNTDLAHPIDIMWWKDRWEILDGIHRLAKAYVLGYRGVKVRKVDAKYIPYIKPN